MKYIYLILIFAFVITISNTSALNTDTFNNSLTAENLTFVGRENITRYLIIQQNSLITTAFMNLSGFYSTNNSDSCFQETANISTACGGLSTGNYDAPDAWDNPYFYLMDGNYSNGICSGNTFDTAIFLMNYTIPSKYSGAIWRVNNSRSSNGYEDYYTIPEDGLTGNTLALRASDDDGDWSMNLSYWNYTKSAFQQLRYRTGGLIYTNCLSEESVNWTNAKLYTQAVNITINNTQVYTYSGNFTHTNNRTSNFSSIIRNYLRNCNYVDGNCALPIQFYSNSSGIIQYSNLQFNSIGFLENNISYNTQVVEQTNNNFTLNISYDINYYTSITGVLIYNNTQYSSTKITTGNDALFYNSIPSPSVNNDTNISFYYILGLTNSTGTTYFNTTTYYQIVKNISITDCATSGSVKIFNFTMYDEDTTDRLRTPSWNQTYEVEVYINDALEFYKNKTSNELSICSNVNITSPLYLDLTLRYDGDGSGTTYVNEYYNLQDYLLINTTTNNNISLYSLKGTSSDEFLITLKDSNYLALTDALIEIKRKYISSGDFKIVEIPKTDSLGKALGHFVVNDEIYTINVRKNGVLLATYSNIQLYCLTGTDCVLNLNIPSASNTPSDYNSYGNILYLAEYNDTTKLYSVSVLTADSSISTINLNAYSSNGVNICSQSITQASGTLICPLSAYSNQTVRITLDNNGYVVLQDYVYVNYKKRTILNPVRYLIAGALIPFFVLMGASSVAFGLIFYIIGIILAGGLFLYDQQGWLGTGSFVSFFVIGIIIILIKVVRSRNNG